MQKLYLRSGATMLYWETWESDGVVTVHEGIFGQVGKFREMPHSRDAARAVKNQVAHLRTQGYAEIAREALYTLSIRYRFAVGSGDMNVCCLVVEPFVALDPVVGSLRQNGCLEGATIAIETEDDDLILCGG